MKTYSEKDIILKLNEYFKSINCGRPVSIEQAEVIGHVTMSLKTEVSKNPLNARVARQIPVRA